MEATYFDGENFEEVRELASNQQRMYIETLIQNASIDEEHKQMIELNYLLFSPEEAEQTINYLQNNQLHPIFDNARPSATDIILSLIHI